MASEAFDLRLAAPFVVLAEELHFGRAAQRLGTRQPALSQQIARLERQLGARLVARAGNRLALTPAGARFATEARAMLERVGLVEAALRGGAGELRLHLGAATHPLVRQIVGSFVAAHPQLVVHTAEGAPSDAPRAVRAGTADAAFGLPQDAPPGVSYAPVATAPLGVATSLHHRLAGRGRAVWTDLEGEPVAFPPNGIANASNMLLRAALRRMGVSVREVVSPFPTARYLVHPITTGAVGMVAPTWTFDPPPAGIAWTVLEPEQHMELGVMWDDRAGGEPARRFVAWARARCDAAAALDACAAGPPPDPPDRAGRSPAAPG